MPVSAEQRRQAKQTRFNPLRTITPAILATALDNFETGWLRGASLIWETIERRVPIVCNAVGKRKRSVSRRPWEVITTDDSAAADQQKQDIEYLCDNLETRDALRGNVRGGMPLLIKQMMNAPFYRYAVHELAWRARSSGQRSALCTFVPLWFFEETTGTLRFTGPLYNSEGSPLTDGEWMVTCGDGIMEAISVAYMFHKLSLEDWVNFSERFGTPGVLGRTKAAKGSTEGDAMAAAVAAFGTDFEGVIYGDDGTVKEALTLIESARTGDQPFQPMVERMERTIVALCRGADLGTLSGKDARGASLQEDESSILEEDDCELISETLQQHLVLPTLRWKYGPGVEPLVKLQIMPSATTDVAQERSTDEFLIKHGVRITTNDLAERYGRTQADDEDNNDDSEIAGVKQASADPEKEKPAAENTFDPFQKRDATGKWTTAGGEASKGDEAKRGKMRKGTDADRKKLAIAPAYKDIEVTDDPDADLLATAKNEKGKTVYFYSDKYVESQAAAKFARIAALHKEVPKIDKVLSAEIAADGPHKHQALALRMITRTGLRNGGEDGGGKVPSYGASSLLTSQARVEGDEVHLDFTGKKGVRQQHSFTDAVLAKHISARQKAGAEKLFDTDDARTREYLSSITDDKFKVHDLRTWHGTTLADAAVRKIEARGEGPKNEKQLKLLQKRVSKIVARQLGNTPAMALKAYIHPAVFSHRDFKEAA